MAGPSTVLDVMRAIAACGLRRDDVEEISVERDRDRRFRVEVETTMREGLIDEIRKKMAGAQLEVKSLRIKRMAGSVRFDVRLHQRFAPWPLTEVNDLFLRTFRVNPTTRVDAMRLEGALDDADPLQVLQALDLIRLRPATYIGTTASALPLFERVFDEYIGRAAAHPGTRIEVSISGDGQASICDDAPGQTLLGPDGADLELNRWLTGGGTVKALSATYREESRHGSHTEALQYAYGRRFEDPRPSKLERDGNRVVFTPDLDIFEAALDPDEVRSTIEWRAMLAPKTTVRFNGEEITFATLQAAARRLAQGPVWGDAVFEFSFDDELVRVDCALAWNDEVRDVHWYVNRQRVGGDGSLEHGLRAALRDAISLGRPELEVEDPLAHLAGVVMAEVPDESAGSRGQYVDPAVDAVLERELKPALSVFLDSVHDARERLISGTAAAVTPLPASGPAPAQQDERERQQASGAERAAARRRRRG